MLAGGLTLADQQRDYFFDVLRERFPDLLPLYQRLYPPAATARCAVAMAAALACRSGSCASRHGICRPHAAADHSRRQARAEQAGGRGAGQPVYAMELDGAPGQRVWAYRKAAWAIEDLEQDIGLVYRQMGRKGLQSIENVGPAAGGGG